MDKHYRIPLTGPQIEQKLMEQSVPLQQGADNAGKVLAVGADGNVELTSLHPVDYSKSQKLTDEQQSQARVNISAVERVIKNSYVIDSGLPLEIDTHDFAMETKTVIGGTATYGVVNIVDATIIQYVPTTILMGVDNVELTFDDETTYIINIVPATVITYDETFATFTNSTAASDSDGDGEVDGLGVWTLVTDENYKENANITQTQNGIYGYDNINNFYSKYGFGKAMKVSVDKTTGSMAVVPHIDLTFKGTGFEIISLTNYDTGIIRITVSDKNGKAIKGQIVDIYYGYIFDETTDKFIVNPDAENVENGSIYQVPIIKMSLDTYDIYSIKIEPIYLNSFDYQKDGSYSFWLDGIRIYNTTGIAGTDYASHDLIGSAYLADQEYNSIYNDLLNTYAALNDTAIADTTIIKLKLENDIYTPIVSSNKYDATQYKSCLGPNMIQAFEIGDIIGEPRCQLGIQLYTNTADTEAQITFIDSFDILGQQSHAVLQTINTATEMYYKVPIVKIGKKNYVIIKNTSATAHISINNAKLFNCNLITQTDETNIKTFIDNITKVANSTNIGTLINNKLLHVKYATDEDVMEMLSELNVINPATLSDGSILISNTGEIYTL